MKIKTKVSYGSCKKEGRYIYCIRKNLDGRMRQERREMGKCVDR